jgi:dihydroxyacid dehydratase/phosphogluconate dehydratase
MNFNALCPSGVTLARARMREGGFTNENAPIVGVICAGEFETAHKYLDAIVAGIKSMGGIAYIYAVPSFGCNAIDPQSAKYTLSHQNLSKSNAIGIIKSNMCESVVVVGDCRTTIAGVVLGCIETNTPVQIMDYGRGNFSSLAPIGVVCDNENKLENAFQCGRAGVNNVTQMNLPKKVFSKGALQTVVDKVIAANSSIGDLNYIAQFFTACGVNVSSDYLFERLSKSPTPPRICKVNGTAIGGLGYAQWIGDRPEAISGKAWVYQNLEDADKAISNGAVPPNSIIVLQNMACVDISSIANVIISQRREHEVGIATDGICEHSTVLCVQLCTPNGFANEEFGNIQNGDILEIDLARGRFNSDTNAKELKNRAKRNPTQKPLTNAF